MEKMMQRSPLFFRAFAMPSTSCLGKVVFKGKQVKNHNGNDKQTLSH